MIRVGSGLDIHALIPGDSLVLAGVSVPSKHQFRAHSDGDVIIHALYDAFAGALGLSDIGTLFPPTDERYKSASSIDVFLPSVYSQMIDKGYTLMNMDINIILDQPKLKPYINQMKKNLSDKLKVVQDRISIKANTTENCLFNHPFEAAMCFATVLIGQKDIMNGEKNDS